MHITLRKFELPCSHCGDAFQASYRQKIRKGHGEKIYCSKLCRSAGTQIGRTKRPEFKCGPCPNCNQLFQSKRKKIFCTMKCYTSSRKFKEMLRVARKKGNKTTSLFWAKEMTKECLFCKEQFRARRKKDKFCRHLCYRKFQADLYDQWIANPEEIALPQNYDEFLTQDTIPCLIEGCDWEGKYLSIHLNKTHGCRVKEFKKAAGFNLSTGLVSQDLNKLMSERHQNTDGRLEKNEALGKYREDNPDWSYLANISKYKSLEGREHSSKARNLMYSMPEYRNKECVECGREFSICYPNFRQIFCSLDCRKSNYKKRYSTPKP